MPRSRIGVMVLIASSVCVSTCGGGGGGSSTPTSPSPTTFTITVNRQNGLQSFSPNPASAGGQMVVFRNADSVVHRVRLNDLSIDTGDIAPGATSRAVQVPANGTNYHCAIHTDMTGSVNAASGAPPPQCEGIYCEPSY
jgi:plastocyanin